MINIYATAAFVFSLMMKIAVLMKMKVTTVAVHYLYEVL